MNEKRKPGGMVQRCIVVHRDDQGFGLTVSGDNPVFVQSIKEGSAAAKAGVQEGDQIMKVNGTTVTNSNHLEVVRLIRSGSYVALTLLGKDNSKSPDNNSNSRPSSGHSRSRSLGNNRPNSSNNPSSPPADSKKNENKINELKRTLTSEHDQYRKLLDDYMKFPSQKSQQELADSQTRIHTVEQQLKALTGAIPPKPQGLQTSFNSQQQWAKTGSHVRPGPGGNYNTTITPTPYQGGNENIKPIEENGSMKNLNKLPNSSSSSSIDSKRSKMDEEDGHQFPFAMPQPITNIEDAVADSSYSFDAMFNKAQQDNLNAAVPFHPSASIVSMEDDEFDSEEERITDHGPFIDLDTLKDRPAHLAVFLHYLMSNSNPVPLLFWLVTDVYSQETSSGKELRRWAYEIYSTFVGVDAPLKITVSEPEEKAIEESFSDPKTSDERMKFVFDVARSIVFIEVNEQLADYRNKRALGLGGLFGDHQLEETMDRNRELRVIDATLLPHLDALMNDSASSNEQNERSIAMAGALATFLKQIGVSVRLLEKCRSFVEKEKTFFFKKKRVFEINKHQFVGQQYTNVTLCNLCDKILWGIGIQGLQCTACEMNVHKRSCVESLTESCPGKRIRRQNNMRPPTSSKPDKVLGVSGGNDDEESGDSRSRNPSFADNSDKHSESFEEVNENNKENIERTGTPSSEEHAASNRSKTVGYNIRNKVPPNRNVSRSESVKSVRDVPKKPRHIATLPGLGKSSDVGIYGPTPFRNRGEDLQPSPTPESDEDNEPDPDLDIESESVNWQSTVVDKKILKKLKSKEIKRQEVIHELIHTERTHVRNLKVLFRVFYKPLLRENIIPKEKVKFIFPNLEELIEIHESLLKPMKELVKKSEVIESIGDIMLNRFDGENGMKVREACAQFCRSQKHSLQQLKKLQISKREVQAFMARQETHDLCRRLQFTDIMASSHQRLVKYPLLLDSICKTTPPSHSDLKNVEKCFKCCREILNHVNDEIKIAEDKIRLEELSKKIENKRANDKDKEDDKENQEEGKFDITLHNLVMEGDLVWKINPSKTLNLHVVLLDDILVLLQITDGGKYILKNHSTGAPGATGDNKGHSPIIKLTNTMVREVATDKTAFFLIHTSLTGPQIYELVAQYSADKKKWVTSINKASDLMKGRGLNAARGRRDGLVSATPATPSPTNQRKHNTITKQPSSVDEDEAPPKDSSNLPSQERINQLTDDLHIKDEQIKKLVDEKKEIIAELRGEKITDHKEEKPSIVPNESKDLLLAAIGQANRLTETINDIITLTKDVCPPEQRNILTESTTALQQHLTCLLEQNNKELKRTPSVDSVKKDSWNLQPRSASASSVVTHSRSHSSPVETPSVPSVEVHNHEDKSKISQHSNGQKESHEDGESTATTEPAATVKQDSNMLMTSPFKIFRKRTSDPCLDPTGIDKQINRAASFSGFSNIQTTKVTEDFD